MGGFGYSQQQQQSHNETGLRGTQYFDNAAGQANASGNAMSGLSKTLMSSPSAMMNYGRQMMPGGQYGLGENADSAVKAMGDYQFGRASGNSATRGQVNPDNMSAVIGSSMQNMLPFLIPQIQQFQQSQFNAPQSLMSTARSAGDYWNQALGSQGSASGSGFGFSANVAGNTPSLQTPKGP